MGKGSSISDLIDSTLRDAKRSLGMLQELDDTADTLGELADDYESVIDAEEDLEINGAEFDDDDE